MVAQGSERIETVEWIAGRGKPGIHLHIARRKKSEACRIPFQNVNSFVKPDNTVCLDRSAVNDGR